MPEPQVGADGPTHGELMRRKLHQAIGEVSTTVQQLLEEIRRNGIPPTTPPPAL